MKIKCFLVLLCLIFGASADAEILLDPQNLKIWDKKKLSDRESWPIKIHGLRMAPLHPSVWGALRSDRTENRRLVPIKPYYLRVSDDRDTAIDRVFLRFSFKRTSGDTAFKNYHAKDSVFDIGFGGSFTPGHSLERPLRDESYVLRLSGFEPAPSGIYFRSHTKFAKIAKPQLILPSGVEHQVELNFRPERTTVFLNGAIFLELDRADLGAGLFYLQTSWNPVKIDELIIEGRTGEEKHKFRADLMSIKKDV